jgi:hypothetical protein
MEKRRELLWGFSTVVITIGTFLLTAELVLRFLTVASGPAGRGVKASNP